jgi:nucleoside phosphorylase
MRKVKADEEAVVDALIVTAIKEELDAVLGVSTGTVDGSRWRPLESPTGLVLWAREFTTSDGGVLRIAVTQALGMGAVQAVAAAAPLLDLHGVRCLSMCGVCAGRRGDTALGDVIIADRLWTYDVGKRKVGKTDTGRPIALEQGDMEMSLIRPVKWKQAAEHFAIPKNARWLRLRPRSYEVQGEWLLARLAQGDDPATHEDRAVKCFDFPTVLARLRKLGRVQKGKVALTAAGRKWITDKLSSHPDGLPEPAPFRTLVGPLATGSKVMEDPRIFEHLSQSVRKVLGLEMEASGIGTLAGINEVPFAVVMKGVMDHADSDKNDNFKTFAARASAECLIAFIRAHLPAIAERKGARPQKTTPPEALGWKQSKLWQQIEERAGKDDPHAREVRDALEALLPKVARVVARDGARQGDFVLHDPDHAFRVAQTMVDVIPPDVRPHLSVYEIAMLLLAAYVHDIGLSSGLDKVHEHYTHILLGSGALAEREAANLQRWLDNCEAGVDPPLAKRAPTPEQRIQAADLTTLYCRDQHEVWTRDWVMEHLSAHRLGSYVAWLRDLDALCSSHCYGYEVLQSKAFDPVTVGSPGVVVNRRYLACVLRVADVLDFDPERTPEVILQHCRLDPTKGISWARDLHLSFQIRRIEEARADARAHILLSAVLESAYEHRALEVVADDVDRELATCHKLAGEVDLGRGVIAGERLPHRWDLPSSVYRQIQPRPDSYEYIDGAFRPSIRRILEMLSGVALYGATEHAVRELLQNAFDAVKEQVARQRLQETLGGANDPDAVRTIRQAYRIVVRVEEREGRAWLTCDDLGVGMTKAIIAKHLLVSGAARRHDLLELERRCRTKGFSVERTGQFGIGVLSYFMLADEVVIETRRSPDAEDHETNGWRFETGGIGTFGALSKCDRIRGTKVSLRLREEVVSDDDLPASSSRLSGDLDDALRYLPGKLRPREEAFSEGGLAAFCSRLRAYLDATLRYLPCKLLLLVNGEAPLEMEPGWTTPRSSFDQPALGLRSARSRSQSDVEFARLPARERRRIEAEERYWAEIREKMAACLEWEVYEFDLPDAAGRARARLPYFVLPGGVALGFLLLRDTGAGLAVQSLDGRERQDIEFHVPSQVVVESYKGMGISVLDSIGRRAPFTLEIDWTLPAKPSLSRDTCNLGPAGAKAVSWLEGELDNTLHRFLERHRTSPYHTLNWKLSRTAPASEARPTWAVLGRDGFQWRTLDYPIACSEELRLLVEGEEISGWDWCASQ